MRTQHLIAPAFFVFAVMMACERPKHDQDQVPFFVTGPSFLGTSLADSIPAKTFIEAELPNVKGVKISFPAENRDVRYFTYEADKTKLINALSKMSFSIHAALADTQCIALQNADLSVFMTNLTHEEQSGSSFFWNADPEEYVAYECIKTPARHLILVSKRSNQILHRIERMG